jgi:hypothetical protein
MHLSRGRAFKRQVPAKSGFYEQDGAVNVFSVFLFLMFCFLLLLVLVDPHAVLPRVSIRTLDKPLWALCRMGLEGEVDAASFRPAL